MSLTSSFSLTVMHQSFINDLQDIIHSYLDDFITTVDGESVGFTKKEFAKHCIRSSVEFPNDTLNCVILTNDLSFMFADSKFNHPLLWNTSAVTNMSNMFACTNFNHPLQWNTSAVTDMCFMFAESNFNHPLQWDTSAVTDMSGMFRGSEFNHPLQWDTSAVTNMSNMFASSAFNHPMP